MKQNKTTISVARLWIQSWSCFYRCAEDKIGAKIAFLNMPKWELLLFWRLRFSVNYIKAIVGMTLSMA